MNCIKHFLHVTHKFFTPNKIIQDLPLHLNAHLEFKLTCFLAYEK
jgi:hypothetical protein